VAIAAFWLACKLEEVIEIDNPNRLTLRNVITVMDRIVRRRDGRRLAVMDPYSQVGARRPGLHTLMSLHTCTSAVHAPKQSLC
jgi:hypothetical protein